MQGSPSQDRHFLNNEQVASAAVPGSQSRNPAANNPRLDGKHVMKKSNQVCRFYGTKKGCRAGEQCPYLHIQKPNPPSGSDDVVRNEPDSSGPSLTTNQTVDSRLAIQDAHAQQGQRTQQRFPGAGDRAPVSKPVPSLQQKDPREFQIGQVVRRFNPSRDENTDGTVLGLKIRPSDPDFPFELEALECVLIVPYKYPKDGNPMIRVSNKDIPRGFQINVERGFDSLCPGSSNRTLLQLLNDLDRHLEQFLTTEKAQTIKIVANRRKEEKSEPVKASVEPTVVRPLEVSIATSPPRPQWSVEERKNAKSKRDAEVRQIEARMGRVPLFSSSKDGVTFNVPIQIPKPSRLPLSLQSLKEVTLIVPTLYNLEPCRIKLKGVVGAEVENVELGFETRATNQKDMTLMAQINYLTQNLHIMAVSPTAMSTPFDQVISPVLENVVPTTEPARKSIEDHQEEVIDQDRPHLRFISQPPPEWSPKAVDGEEPDSESTDEFDTEDDESDMSEDRQSLTGGASVPVSAPASNLEKGVLLSFPHLELHGIELLELRDISLSIKCDRCKEAFDIKSIKPAEAGSTSIRTESCNKCASPVSVSYRSEPMHINSIRAGYLDLEGCTIVDMLPSHFLATCSECSTSQPPPGIISVRGESPMAVCRECHHRLNFKIPEVKFLRVSSNDPRLNLPLKSKRKKENLGITAGSELPDRGRCKHYSKSYRWFRFSCCNRVYPCDRCHDAKEEHPNEHANRMICGWCSREQNYRPEDCHSCGRSVIRKTGGGFWEGGKGTRDKNKMSRKDPRKFKRIGCSAKGGEK